MSGAANLYKLQQIDSKLDAHRKRLAEVEEQLGDNTVITHAEAELAILATATAEARRARQTVKNEYDQVENKRNRGQERLYSGAIKNPKELQDLQDEGDALQRRLDVLEENELEALIELEDAEAIENNARTALEELTTNWLTEQAALSDEKAQLEKEIERLEIEQEAALIPIKSADRETYAKLRKSKGGLAVTRLEEGACAICGVSPSSSRVQQARSSTDLIRCGNCGRILYVP